MSRRCLGRLIACVALLIYPALAAPCPFCTMQGQTLINDVNQASMVLVGTFANARMGENFGEGTTDLIIESVIKRHEILGDKKVITVPRYVPTDDKKYKFLVLCDVFKGKVDPYRGVPVRPDADIAGYVEGALKVKDKKTQERLLYYFKYLDNPEVEIANDAYKEFGNADYKDLRDIAPSLPADKVVAWLKDPNTPAFRYGLYASMLGHCGKPEHAPVLRDMLDDPQKRLLSGVDGILAGYTLLKPKEGWDYIQSVFKDPARDFTQRYAALRTVRFLYENRPDLVDRKDLVESLGVLIEQGDIADLAIEDLRKWGRWERADQVLGLYDRKSHDVPIIRRSILRYALSCKGPDGGPLPKAAAFVAALRKKDPQLVSDAEELLKLETTPVPGLTDGSKNKK